MKLVSWNVNGLRARAEPKQKAMSMVLSMGVDFSGDNGRIITLEYSDFYLVTAYVPTGTGGKRARQFRKTGHSLRRYKYCTQRIDLSYPDHKSAGYTYQYSDADILASTNSLW